MCSATPTSKSWHADGAASGSRFSASASPSLAHLVRNAALDLPHPTEPGKTLWDATKDTGKYFGAREDVVVWDAEAASIYEASMTAQDDLGVGTLGSGSDFTVFLQRIGVSLTVTFFCIPTDHLKGCEHGPWLRWHTV